MGMTREEALCIAEEFSEWLEDISEKYRWDKDEIQALIKQFLMWGERMSEFPTQRQEDRALTYEPPHLEPDNCGNYIIQEPTAKNDLGVDCMVDVLGSYTDLDIPYKREIAENILTKLPSVTPQGFKKETITYLDGFADGLNMANNSTNKMLGKIRAEIEKTKTTMNMFNREDTKQYAIAMEDVLKIIDRYKIESEEHNAV